MKFEDLLMDRSEQKQTRVDLEEEVVKLQQELEGEQVLNRALKCALHGPVSAHPRLSSLLPPQVQKLLSELAMVEEEIVWLERKVEEMKLRLHEERKQSQDWQMMLQLRSRRRHQPNHLLCGGSEYQAELKEQLQQPPKPKYSEDVRKHNRHRRKACIASSSYTQCIDSTRSTEDLAEEPRWHVARSSSYSDSTDKESGCEKPNELSEELIKCLIGVFLELNQEASQHQEGSSSIPKLTLACMNSRAFIGKTSLSCRIAPSLINDSSSNLDPYDIFPDSDWSCFRDIGPYKNCIQITRTSLDITRFPECLPAIGKLRGLMHRLCNVDLTLLTYKEKLAFWINIYNACIMHAFLEQGLPSTQEKLLVLMNKAALNVGGIVLNALAIEHFILRHPYELKHGLMDEKEKLLRHAYGLGFPEPNVTFALCRGSRSSPALRVYTPEEVVNELGKAKVEYLEASVGITSKRKIMVPKLLQWHMRDFADDMESLVEWIYSQLPRTGSLKRLMMECLNYEPNSSATKMVEIQPYEFEFRYLLSL